MKLEKGSISGRALIFAVFCFMQGTMLRSAFIVVVTKNDSWAMAFTGLLGSLLLTAIYAALLRRFQEKNLFEINELVFGPVVGKVFSVLYLFFFLSLAALNTHDIGDFVVGYMMQETPLAAIILLFVLICVYAVRKGIANIVRLSTVLCIIAMSAVLINTVLMLNEIQPGFIKPLFQLPLGKYVQGTITVAALPMGEVLAFTMIAPMLGKNKKAGKMMAYGLVLAAVFLGIVLLRDILVLGPMAGVFRLPSYESVRYVKLAGILTRMESLYAVVLIILYVFKVSILLYACVLGLAQLVNFKSYQPLTLICGALVFFYSLFVYKSVMEHADWGATVAPIFSLTFELVLPSAALVAVSIKKTIRLRET